MISLPIWIRHLGVLTYEDSACTDENDFGDGDQLSEIYQFNRKSGTKGRFIDLISGDTADTILAVEYSLNSSSIILH